MINISNQLIDKNDINSVIHSAINIDGHNGDSGLSEDRSEDFFEETSDNMNFKERRIEKAERRVNDNHGYRGPARRLTIDRRK